MYRLFGIILLALGLSACQVIPTSAQDFDPSRNFSQYKSYQWAASKLKYQPDDVRIKSDLTEARITQAVQQELDKKGISITTKGAQADITIQAYLILENKQDQIDTGYGAWGGYWGPYWGGGPNYTQRRTIHYTESTLQLDFFDTKDGKLVWRGSVTQIHNTEISDPRKKEAEIQKAVIKLLQKYPPNPF